MTAFTIAYYRNNDNIVTTDLSINYDKIMNSGEKLLNYSLGCSIILFVKKNGGLDMNHNDETQVLTDETLEETAEVANSAESRWIDEDNQPEPEKKKKPLLQVPVIISICLVAASLLAFLAYRFVFIAEPEGVIWKWHSDSDEMDYYFEFQDNNTFKAYFGSFEITANYTKEKNDNGENTLMISDSSMSVEKIGCFTMGEKMKYDISGLRIGGNQEMTFSSDDDIVMKQSDKWVNPLELPEDFKEDEDLTGEWVNVFSSDNAKQTLLFNDDGSHIEVIDLNRIRWRKNVHGYPFKRLERIGEAGLQYLKEGYEQVQRYH